MGEKTGIHWTDHTFNPWIGCMKVSPGCANCYAETLATNRMGLKVWGPAATTHRKMMSEDYWKQPLKWNKKASEAGKRERVFCASMADVFEEHPEVVESRDRLWKLIEATPSLDWLLLTKRPENMFQMLPDRWLLWQSVNKEIVRVGIPKNVWLGTSAENKDEFLSRWPVLEAMGKDFAASVLFLSLEPLLEPIDIEPAFWWQEIDEGKIVEGRQVDWVIVGGESGPGCRPMNLDWARSIRDQCREAGIPFFFKQIGGAKKIDGVAGGDLLDGQRHYMWPGDEWDATVTKTLPAGALDGKPKIVLTQLRMF